MYMVVWNNIDFAYKPSAIFQEQNMTPQFFSPIIYKIQCAVTEGSPVNEQIFSQSSQIISLNI